MLRLSVKIDDDPLIRSETAFALRTWFIACPEGSYGFFAGVQ